MEVKLDNKIEYSDNRSDNEAPTMQLLSSVNGHVYAYLAE